MIPNRGAWIEYETDTNGVVFARIDRARKLPVTVLLRAMDVQTDDEIYEKFGADERVKETIKRDAEQVKDNGEPRFLNSPRSSAGGDLRKAPSGRAFER